MGIVRTDAAVVVWYDGRKNMRITLTYFSPAHRLKQGDSLVVTESKVSTNEDGVAGNVEVTMRTPDGRFLDFSSSTYADRLADLREGDAFTLKIANKDRMELHQVEVWKPVIPT